MARLRELNALWRYAHVVLAPHLDDAVLSLGATIGAFTARGERVLIYTICAGLPSPLDELNPVAETLTGGGAHAWVQLRREEDARAADVLGADHAFDTALDAIFRDPRRYAGWDEVFGVPDPKDILHLQAYAAISVIASIAERAAIYAPLGIGEHVDHQIVCAAAQRAVPNARLFFYEDFPYVLKIGRAREGLEPVPRPQRVTRLKEQAIAAYASQIERLFGGEAKMRAAVRAAKRERLWRAINAPRPL